MKTNKSWKKRFKLTKNGKLVARRPNQNHHNAKDNGAQRRKKRRPFVVTFISKKTRNRFMSHA